MGDEIEGDIRGEERGNNLRRGCVNPNHAKIPQYKSVAPFPKPYIETWEKD